MTADYSVDTKCTPATSERPPWRCGIHTAAPPGATVVQSCRRYSFRPSPGSSTRATRITQALPSTARPSTYSLLAKCQRADVIEVQGIAEARLVADLDGA